MRVTLTISDDADQMLDELAARDMRSRGAVVEILIRAARSATTVPQPCHNSATTVPQEYAQAHTTVPQLSHSNATTVCADAYSNDTTMPQEPRDRFDRAMLDLDKML